MRVGRKQLVWSFDFFTLEKFSFVTTHLPFHFFATPLQNFSDKCYVRTTPLFWWWQDL